MNATANKSRGLGSPHSGTRILIFQNHLCDGVLGSVSKRQCNMFRSQLSRKLRGFSMEGDRRTPSRQTADFYVSPGHTVVPSGANRLHGRFFGGKTGRITLHPVGFRIAVANFALSKDAANKP